MTPVLLVTRPVETAKNFAKAVSDQLEISIPIIFSPALEIVPASIPEVGPIDHLIATSTNGLRQASRLNVSVRHTTWCVGRKTTEFANALGLNARFAGENVEELLVLLSKESPKGTMVHLSGTHVRGDIAGELEKMGMNARRIIAYDQKLNSPTNEAINALSGKFPVVWPVFSPRSASHLRATVITAPMQVIAISAVVKGEVLRFANVEVAVATQPDEIRMVDATVRVLDKLIQQFT